MCGRFCIAASPGEIEERYGVNVPIDYMPRYNLSPGQKILTISRMNNGSNAKMADWGFQAGVSHPVINAKMETISERPLFRNLYPEHRCLIPCSGYYEWVNNERQKIPWFFFLEHENLISFAGLLKPIHSGSQVVILTTEAVLPIQQDS